MDKNKKPSEPSEAERWAERNEYVDLNLTTKYLAIWVIVLLGNIFAKKYAPQIMAWYPTYTIIIGFVGTLYFGILEACR